MRTKNFVVVAAVLLSSPLASADFIDGKSRVDLTWRGSSSKDSTESRETSQGGQLGVRIGSVRGDKVLDARGGMAVSQYTLHSDATGDSRNALGVDFAGAVNLAYTTNRALNTCGIFVGPTFKGDARMTKGSSPRDRVVASAAIGAGLSCREPSGIILMFGPTAAETVGQSMSDKTLGANVGMRIQLLNPRLRVDAAVTNTVKGVEDGGRKLAVSAEVDYRVLGPLYVGGAFAWSAISDRDAKQLDGTPAPTDLTAVSLKAVAGVTF